MKNVFKPNLLAITLASLIGIAACGDSTPPASPVAEQSAELTPEQMFAATLKDAEKGDAVAQSDLGMMYYTGEGVSKDVTKAVVWSHKAAEQGNANAQLNLGMLYSNGEGISQDAVKAAEWTRKAAEQGNANAQDLLGDMYSKGEGVPKASSTAVMWWQKAATQGDARAQSTLGSLYARGEDVPKDAIKAVEWLQKAVAQGDKRAQFNLGVMYSAGEGVPKNAVKAGELFQKAAAQGFAKGQLALGWLYDNGEGLPADKVLAYVWYNLAAAQGNEDAKTSRNRVELQLSPRDLQEATRLSSNWGKGQIITRENSSALTSGAVSGSALVKRGTGTVFVISNSGHAITNQHVIHGCAELRIEGRDGTAKPVTDDKVNDLALLKISGIFKNTAAIAKDPQKLRQGEDIVVFGYPLNSVLSSGGNLTPGVVSALTGLGNNTNQIQITAPIQPGSSGSPVLNKKGEVTGVVSMKLSDKEMTKATGQVGQNVNFAVSGQTLKTFLDTHKVEYRTGGFMYLDKSTADLADEARNWTMVVECWK